MIEMFEVDEANAGPAYSPRDIRAMLERVDQGIGLLNELRQFLVMKLPVPKEARERFKAIWRGYGPVAIDLMRVAVGLPENALKLETENKSFDTLMEVTE